MLIMHVISLPSHKKCGCYGNGNKGTYVLQATHVLVSKLSFLKFFQKYKHCVK